MDWYTVNTKPKQETFVADSLRKLGLETFCPLLKQTKIIRRKRRTTTGPLFPGYLFVRFDLNRHYRSVNYARGVRKVVSFGSIPAKVEDEIIESIGSRMSDGYISVQPSSLTPGQLVKIQEGPFQGLEAVFEHELSDRQRVVLLLRELSYQARVVVSLEQVVGY